jgi:DNA-binding NtrC family response regulator
MKKILIIDDEDQFCWMMKQIIEELGPYKVIIATGGKIGIKAAKKENPDLIFLDIAMPDMNGLKVLNRLNIKRKTKDIPVIMLTGIDNHKTIDAANYQYAAQYIVKPPNLQEVDVAIKQALSFNE